MQAPPTGLHPLPMMPPYQWPGATPMFPPAPVILDPVAQQQMIMMMQQQLAMYQQQMVYHDGHTPGPHPMMPHPQGASVPFIPTPEAPPSHHVTTPTSNVTSGGNTTDGEPPKPSGLFIPPVAPEQQKQKLLQSSTAQTPKQSQAIPIVSPNTEQEKKDD